MRVGMHEAKTNLSRLVARAQEGEEIVIQRNGTPVARLVAVEEEATRPRMMDLLGVYEGQIHIADDFDDLPDDMAEDLGMR